MDIADTCCEHCYAKVCNSLALVGISALAHTNYAVFFAADGTNLSLEGETENVAGVNKSSGLFNVLSDRIVRTIEHDGREACVDASLCSLKGTVVEVKSNRNSDVQAVHHSAYHSLYGLETAHIFTSAFGNTEDNRSLEFLNSLKYSLCPFKVVDVDLSNSILAVTCFDEHVLSGN